VLGILTAVSLLLLLLLLLLGVLPPFVECLRCLFALAAPRKLFLALARDLLLLLLLLLPPLLGHQPVTEFAIVAVHLSRVATYM